MKEFLHHLFVPRESNNHRSKILHHKSLVLVIAFLVISQFFLPFFNSSLPSILGISTDISSQELLLLINQKRQDAGLSPLTINEQLAKAALFKANDMFAKNYWSHNSPDGVTPWTFIKSAGYTYTYAGENLARGFSTSKDVVDAWMASPSHKENILSPNYQDIGFTIMEGKLLGENTVLVVEMFGNTGKPVANKTINRQVEVLPQSTSIKENELTPNLEKNSNVEQLFSNIKKEFPVDISLLSRNVGIAILSLFILALLMDIVIIERKKIIRMVGHNTDHIFFLTAVLIFILILSKGVII